MVNAEFYNHFSNSIHLTENFQRSGKKVGLQREADDLVMTKMGSLQARTSLFYPWNFPDYFCILHYCSCTKY